MALLSPRTPTRSGVNLAAAAAAVGGDTFANTGQEVLYIKNGGGGSINATIAMPLGVDGVALAGKVVAVGPAAEMMIGPFPSGIYTDPATGLATVTYSGVTSVTVAIIKYTAAG